MAAIEIQQNQTTKKTVYIKVVFTRLSNVNTIKGQFNADIGITARWREKELDGRKGKMTINGSDYWNPGIQVQNIVTEILSRVRYKVRFNQKDEAFLVERTRLKGTFSDKLQLNDFPFDSQDMTISFTSKFPDEEVDLQADNDRMSYICTPCFIYQREWQLRNFVESTPRIISKEFSDEGQNKTFPGLDVHVMAARKYAFFMWNIIIIMTMISSLPVTTFAIDRNNPQRRLLLGFILALTGVAFRFMANQNIPKVSYQTLLDRYLLASMMYNYVVCVWHVIVSRYEDSGDTQRDMDLWAFVGAVILYVLIQLVFLTVVIVKTYRKNKMFTEKETSYQEKRVKSLKNEKGQHANNARTNEANSTGKDKVD